MKKMESNVRSGRDHMREPRPGKRGGNVRMRVERMAESVDGMLAESGHDTKEAVGKSEGKESASVCGCNANNGNASARTLNCNNGLGNGNSNYSGAFAVISGRDTVKEIGKNLTSRAASTKNTDGRAATGGYGRCDYDSLPFVDGETKAESDATSYRKEAVYEELKTANSKRKLKNLKRFFTDPIIIEAAFDRTLDRTDARDAECSHFLEHKKEICERIRRELTEETFRSTPTQRRRIRKKGKGDKDRNADVSTLYERIMQTLVLIVVERKFRNMFIRNIYSGIPGRSLLSNDKRYCMINQIRHAVKTSKGLWAGQTDIRKFYESLRMKIVLGVLFNTIVCPYTRRLLVEIFRHMDRLPIGCCLSQMFGMATILDCDREIKKRFNVKLFCFGDNRLMIGEKDEVRRVIEWQMGYYESAYELEVKGDWQMRKVEDGFRFCKYDYKGSFVKVRAEIRRRAIRAHKRGTQNYAGYKGILKKTDSKRLRELIETMKIVNKHGMTVTTQRGEKKKLRDLKDGVVVVPVEYKIEPSAVKEKQTDGEEAMMVRMTYVAINDGEKRLYHSTEGSEEIVGFFQLVDEGKAELRQKLHIVTNGTKVAFAEYHTTAEEACDIICKELGI